MHINGKEWRLLVEDHIHFFDPKSIFLIIMKEKNQLSLGRSELSIGPNQQNKIQNTSAPHPPHRGGQGIGGTSDPPP